MQPRALVRKAAEDDEPQRRRRGQRLDRRCDRYPRRAIGRETIDAGGDRRKGHRSKAMGLAQLKGAAIARRQRLIFALAATVPNRANGMNHIPCRQPITPGDFGVTSRATMQRAAFG